MLISINGLHTVLSPCVDPRSFGLPFPVPFDTSTWLAVVRWQVSQATGYSARPPSSQLPKQLLHVLLLPLEGFSPGFDPLLFRWGWPREL